MTGESTAWTLQPGASGSGRRQGNGVDALVALRRQGATWCSRRSWCGKAVRGSTSRAHGAFRPGPKSALGSREAGPEGLEDAFERTGDTLRVLAGAGSTRRLPHEYVLYGLTAFEFGGANGRRPRRATRRSPGDGHRGTRRAGHLGRRGEWRRRPQPRRAVVGGVPYVFAGDEQGHAVSRAACLPTKPTSDGGPKLPRGISVLAL